MKRSRISDVDEYFAKFCLLNRIYGIIAEGDEGAWEETMQDVFKVAPNFHGTRMELKNERLFVLSREPLTSLQKRQIYAYFRKIAV